jgi:hypothetical protein
VPIFRIACVPAPLTGEKRAPLRTVTALQQWHGARKETRLQSDDLGGWLSPVEALEGMFKQHATLAATNQQVTEAGPSLVPPSTNQHQSSAAGMWP